jgi:hypothetical protein
MWNWLKQPALRSKPREKWDSQEGRRYRQGWMAAGTVLGQDPSATVTCPSCGIGILVVTDAMFSDGSGVERWMRCNVCRHANTMLMRNRPPSPQGST